MMFYNQFHHRLYCSGDNNLWIIDPALLQIEGAIPIGWGLTQLAFDSIVHLYCTMAYNRMVLVIDCRYDSVVTSLALPRDPQPIVYSPSLRRMLVGSPRSSALTIFRDTLTGAFAERTSTPETQISMPTMAGNVLDLPKPSAPTQNLSCLVLLVVRCLALNPEKIASFTLLLGFTSSGRRMGDIRLPK
ncbi:MAG: YncE family protein [bacterium]